MDTLQQVRASCEWMMKEYGDFVSIASERELQTIAEQLPVSQFDPFESWRDSELGYPTEWNADTIDWIFVSDLLNFSFWNDVREGSGFWQLIVALNAHPNLTNPKEYANIAYADFCACFTDELPLMR